MKKFLVLTGILAGAMLFAGVCNADPVYSARTLVNGVTLYVVGGATTTAATVDIDNADVSNSTFTFETTGGLYPGTTQFYYSDLSANTITAFMAYVNALPVTTPGVEGGVVATLPSLGYASNPALSLDITTTSCLGTANAVTIPLTTTQNISYVIPASSDKHARIVLNNINVNATFASGSTTITIYDGGTASCEVLRKYTVPTTAVDCDKIIEGDELRGSPGAKMRIEVVGTAALSAGYLNFTYKYQK